jgi:hypothetical protein
MPAFPMGRRGRLGDFPMSNYSIVRDGNEYVVRADDKSVLKISSRRRAVKLISDATELLLQQQPALSEEEGASVVPDLGAIPDPQVP